MAQFEFVTNLKKLDDRATFANKTLKLLYQKHNGDIDEAVKESDKIGIFDDFEEHVKNIYEIVEEQIPLYAYYRLMKYGADNFYFTDEEFETAKKNAIKACKLYYS